jgi:DNA-binding PadR family transcriptional regulator
MSVKHGLLALLVEGPRYGYELKSGFEARTGATWPLNVGQVYTTLARLERDELVARDGEDAEGHVLYRITPRGLRELEDWWEVAVEREAPVRDELAIKLALAVGTPGVDARDVVQRQRTATVRALQSHTRRKASVAPGDTAAALVLDALVFAAEAEVRWLDHCEARLVRSRNGVSR